MFVKQIKEEAITDEPFQWLLFQGLSFKGDLTKKENLNTTAAGLAMG